MGIYSSGNKWKRRAQAAEAEAAALTEEQQREDFGRNLLANIRQQRLAAAQLESMKSSDIATSSTEAGAAANVNSALAGEMGYSYRSTARMQQIQDYQQMANAYYKKYQKQQKTRATAIQVTGIVAGAVAGAALAPVGAAALGAAAGATVGQGVGQMANKDIAGGLGTIAKGVGQWSNMPAAGGTPGVDEAADKYLNASTGGGQSTFTYANQSGTMSIKSMWSM